MRSHESPLTNFFDLISFGATYHHGTMFAPKQCISKGCYGEGEPKNVNLESAQQACRHARACKLPCFTQNHLHLHFHIPWQMIGSCWCCMVARLALHRTWLSGWGGRERGGTSGCECSQWTAMIR